MVIDEKLNLGTGTTIGSFILGFVPTISKVEQDAIMFWFQIGAFSITMIVGVITFIYYCKKIKQNKL